MFGRFITLILLWGSVTMISHADESVWPDVLKAAYQSHLLSVSAGRMQFSTDFHQQDSGEQRHVEGRLEWDSGYYFFDGTVKEERTAAAGVETRDQSVRIVVLDGMALAWRDERQPLNRVHVIFVPESKLTETGVAGIMPDPRVLLASLEANSSKFEKGWLEYPLSPITPDSDLGPVSRVVAEEDRHIRVKAAYRAGWEQDVVFDLDAGSLFRTLRTRRSQENGVVFEDTKWQWSQSADGRWFPKDTSHICTRGTVFPETYATYACHIESFEPLLSENRTMKHLGSEREFGPIPPGGTLTRATSDGRIESEVVPILSASVSTEVLDSLARSLSSTGFGALKK